MTGALSRHKVLILLISLVIISLFVVIAYFMPKSSKIPSKGVFVIQTISLQKEICKVNTIRNLGMMKI